MLFDVKYLTEKLLLGSIQFFWSEGLDFFFFLSFLFPVLFGTMSLYVFGVKNHLQRMVAQGFGWTAWWA